MKAVGEGTQRLNTEDTEDTETGGEEKADGRKVNRCVFLCSSASSSASPPVSVSSVSSVFNLRVPHSPARKLSLPSPDAIR